MTSIPVVAGPIVDLTSYVDFANLSVQGANYTYLDSTIKLSLASINSSSYMDIMVPFHNTFDLSSYSNITFQFSAEPESLFSEYLGTRACGSESRILKALSVGI